MSNTKRGGVVAGKIGDNSSARSGSPNQSREIAIIGMSGRFPGGANSPELLWESLRSGADLVTEARGDRWDLGWHNPDPSRDTRVYTSAGGYLDQIDKFDADFFGLSPREARQVDPQQRLLLELAWEAHESAGISPRSRAGSDTGVFVGISSNDYATLIGPLAPDAYSNTGSSMSIAANRISYIFDFHGPSISLDTACSSSIVCIHQACNSILAGECSTALAGGVSILMTILPWLGFSRASMLSPSGRCKSFDASGDGYVRSEGGGLVLLKRLADAERDGDPILGVILASGVNQDGRTMGLSMPNGNAQERLLRTVYSQCSVSPEDVFYVEAHGTGTSVGDPIECGALGRVLGMPRGDGSRCLIGSVKSNIGHLEAASGIAGLTKVLLTLKHREIPGNLHFADPNPKIDFENWRLGVVTESTLLPDGDKPVVIGVNSFGFGGTNAHLVIQEYRRSANLVTKPVEGKQSFLFLSGHSEAALREVAQSYVDLLREAASENWKTICAGAATCRSLLRYRLVVSATDAEEAVERLERYLGGKSVAGLATGSAQSASVPIAFVYSGNGPQWWGMGRELLAGNQVFRDQIKSIDEIFFPLSGWSLIEEMGRPEIETGIALTEFAQPLLFALQLGLTSVLREAGVIPAAVLGHSVGEVAAAYASGALSLEQATQVIFYRSKAQSGTAGRGRMAALGVSESQAREVMNGIDGWLEVAAINAPESVTVAGDPAALNQMIEALTVAGKFARLLALNYPFHTRAMEPIREELLVGLNGLRPGDSNVPFISTVQAAEMKGAELDAEYWYRNVREPVQFDAAVTHLLRDRGFTVFLEIGPHPVLKDYISQTAKAGDHHVASLPTLRRPGLKGPEPEFDHLWTAVSACYAHGSTDLASIFVRPNPVPDLPLYPWQRSLHWRGSVLLPDTFYPIKRDHPLLGYRVPAGDGLWENTIDLNRLTYLADHVVQDAVLFPATAHIELGLAAGRLTFGGGTIDIENFEILRPLTISSHTDPLVQVFVDSKDGTFEVRSRAERLSEDWTIQARGRLSRAEGAQVGERMDLVKAAARMPHLVSSEEHYAGATMRGLSYGKTFQGITNIALTSPDAIKREALADIELPSLDSSALAEYLAHPALLDCCLQLVITLIGQNDRRNTSTLPVQIGRLRSFAPLTSSIVCHLAMQQESVRSAVANFRVMDTAGNLLLTMDEVRCQKVDFGRVAASPMIEEWWRLDPYAEVLAPLSALPTPALISIALKASITQIVQAEQRGIFYREVLPRMDQLMEAYAVSAIKEIHPDKVSFDLPTITRTAGAKRDRVPLLTRLLRIAVEAGQLTKSDGLWIWRGDYKVVSADSVWRSLLADHPRYQAELLLLAQIGETLVGTLRGELSVAENNAALLDQLADTAPFQASYNQIVRTTVEKLVATWPADRPIRILEIGGAAGGLAAWVLPVLPPTQTDYLLTDASEADVARAEHRLSGHRFARFAALDLERDFIEQGMAAGYFDLVVGSNALQTSHAPAALLSRLQTVMTPDGQFLFVEAQPSRITEFILDHVSTPTLSADKRFASSLRTSTAWLDLLAANSFDNVLVLSDAEACVGSVDSQKCVLFGGRTTVDFASVQMTSPPQTFAPRRVLLVVEQPEGDVFHRKVVEDLLSEGHDATLLYAASADPDLESTIMSAWKETLPDQVVYISGRSSLDVRGRELIEGQNHRCLTVLELVRAFEANRQNSQTQLKLVTRGAFTNAFGDGPLDPGQAPVWGLGRVVSNEQPSLNIRLIDVHSHDPNASLWLATELLREDDETEVQLSAGYRFVNRERLMSMTDEARQAIRRKVMEPISFVLDTLQQGGLDSLYLRESARTAPGPDQVEIGIRAAGLNFRDVLWSMGMLPEEAVENGFSGPTIGMECSGEILRVGAGVSNFEVGERVVAFASSCFASHVTTEARSVARIPAAMGFNEAATIPTAFLTAWYALDHLARLSPGESILIHGAAGGVGMAAIQIAKLKGAKVFGTAGSARKRRMLQRLGVDHILDSRSLDFADEVMALTDGIGVDVVLNSLAGEAITKSLGCLRPFGRFLEIGKRDLYANTRIGLRPFRNNLSYFGIDADTLLTERPDLASAVLRTVMDHFESGALRPLPFQSVPISRASEAFRTMQQSKHVGKLVVSLESDEPALLPVVRSTSIVKSDVTYLVSGGLGGFGFATAKWLVEQGATSLALVGRRGSNSIEGAASVAELEDAGVTVKAYAADIADGAAVVQIVADIRATMLPLKGVIHSAAVIEDAPILNISREQLDRVLSPKILGAWNLHEATLQDSLDMFVLYSSSSSVVGNPGQGAYVAGNLYLDSLAQYRSSLGLAALSVGWGAIKDAGFLTRHTAVADMLRTRTGLDATPSREALEDLGRLSAVGATRVCVARFDLKRLGQMLPGVLVPRFYPIISRNAAIVLQSEETLLDRLIAAPEENRREMVIACVREHAAHVLGTSAGQIDTEQSLSDLGLDSLMAVELAVGLERELAQPVSVMQMLSAGTVTAIADLAMKMLQVNRSAEEPSSSPIQERSVNQEVGASR